jgi:hypothetical protein
MKAIKSNVSDLICYMSHKAGARGYGQCDEENKCLYTASIGWVGIQTPRGTLISPLRARDNVVG